MSGLVDQWVRGLLSIDKVSQVACMAHIACKNWMFAGSQSGGKAMAIAFALTETAKLNNVDSQAWLTDVLGRIADHKSPGWMN